jgi:hypothetical protein
LVLAAEALNIDIPSPFDPARSREFERLLMKPGDAGILSPAALERLGERRVLRRRAAALLRSGSREVALGDRVLQEYTPFAASHA